MPISTCVKCGAQGTVIKDGFHNTDGRKVQRYRCRSCQRRYILQPKYSILVRALAVKTYDTGFSAKACATLINQFFKLTVSKSTVENWNRRAIGKAIVWCCAFRGMDVNPAVQMKIVKSKEWKRFVRFADEIEMVVRVCRNSRYESVITVRDLEKKCIYDEPMNDFSKETMDRFRGEPFQ